MKRFVLFIVLFALVLAGCGGSSGDVTVPDPPKSTVFEKSDNAQINKIVDEWKTQVPATLVKQQVKPETIEQKIYQSTASLQEIADFYKTQLTAAGWVEVARMPGLQDGFFTTGFDHGNIHLVVAALDASKFGDQGVIVYTAKGST